MQYNNCISAEIIAQTMSVIFSWENFFRFVDLCRINELIVILSLTMPFRDCSICCQPKDTFVERRGRADSHHNFSAKHTRNCETSSEMDGKRLERDECRIINPDDGDRRTRFHSLHPLRPKRMNERKITRKFCYFTSFFSPRSTFVDGRNVDVTRAMEIR